MSLSTFNAQHKSPSPEIYRDKNHIVEQDVNIYVSKV